MLKRDYWGSDLRERKEGIMVFFFIIIYLFINLLLLFFFIHNNNFYLFIYLFLGCYTSDTWFGKAPSFEHLRVLSCTTHAKIVKAYIKKLNDKSLMTKDGIFWRG